MLLPLQFTVASDRCIQCGQCALDCPVQIISMAENSLPFIAEQRASRCLGCQHCLTICPAGAISIMGLPPENSIPLRKALPGADQLEALLCGRRSIRKFKDSNVPQATLTRLLNVAACAPTGKNNEQVLLTVVDDKTVMQQLRQMVMDGIAEKAESGTLPKEFSYAKSFLHAWHNGQDVIFRHAPHMLITSAPEDGPSPAEDAIIALCQFEIMAQTMQVGTLWCGFAQWALMHICPDVGQLLNIPRNHRLGYTMLFGIPAVQYHRTAQRKARHVNRVVLEPSR